MNEASLNNSMIMNEWESVDFRQKIIDFYNSPEFRCLAEHYGRKNLFDILGVSRVELVHSRMLKWILDPSETHCLNHFPLKKLLQTVAFAKTSYAGNRDSKLDPNLADAFIAESYRILDAGFQIEKTVPSLSGVRVNRRLDLFASLTIKLDGESTSISLPIILENKVDTDEQSEQTKDYSDWANNEFKEGSPIFVFLTPCSIRELQTSESNGCSSRDFIHVNYQLLSEMVFGPCLERMSDSPAKTLLSDYLRCLSYADISTTGASFDNNSPHNDKPNKGRTIMAIPEAERRLLTQFWEKNKELLNAALEAISDDPDSPMSNSEQNQVKKVLGLVKRSQTRYRFDGKSGLARGKLVSAVVEKWVRDNNPQSFDDVLRAFPAEKIKGARLGIVRPDNWAKFEGRPDFKDRDFTALPISGCDKLKIWVRIWWEASPFENFLKFIKEKHPQYVIETDD